MFVHSSLNQICIDGSKEFCQILYCNQRQRENNMCIQFSVNVSYLSPISSAVHLAQGTKCFSHPDGVEEQKQKRWAKENKNQWLILIFQMAYFHLPDETSMMSIDLNRIWFHFFYSKKSAWWKKLRVSRPIEMMNESKRRWHIFSIILQSINKTWSQISCTRKNRLI